MKKFILATLLCTPIFALAGSGGSEGTGGGDLCEARIQSIRDDLKSWIAKNGHFNLSLTYLSVTQYAQKMNSSFGAKVQCVSQGDRGYPVEVNGTAKECRFDRTKKGSFITCDAQKFGQRSEAEQYVLIHHEYAGIAGIETPEGDVSDYQVSNQISAYLVDTLVKRLAVKSSSTPLANADEFNNWSNWQRADASRQEEIESAIKIAVRSAEWSDCNVKFEPYEKGIFGHFSPINTAIRPFKHIPIGAGARALFESKSGPRMIRQHIGGFIDKDADEVEMELRIDVVIDLDPSETKITRVRIIKQQKVDYNEGTITSPKWTSKLVPRRSVTCHAL